GLVLAEDITSAVALPPFDNSSVDGYAVRLADVEGAAPESPAELAVIGDIAAGTVYPGVLEPGQSLRIMTGAPIPEGAEAVVPVAAVNAMGATGIRVGIVNDDPQGVLDSIEDQLIRADVVITTGGVSVGAYDVVKEVLSTLGTVDFAKVAMQPGMPQGFGTVG